MFCDTYAPLKLYIVEKDSDRLKARVSEAEAVAVCRIAWAEAHAALSRRAGEYADTFALRGYDSVQLAAAFEVGRISQSPLFFACFDTRLNKAAKLLGMLCFQPLTTHHI